MLYGLRVIPVVAHQMSHHSDSDLEFEPPSPATSSSSSGTIHPPHTVKVAHLPPRRTAALHRSITAPDLLEPVLAAATIASNRLNTSKLADVCTAHNCPGTRRRPIVTLYCPLLRRALSPPLAPSYALRRLPPPHSNAAAPPLLGQLTIINSTY
jgi:hypothetical protein